MYFNHATAGALIMKPVMKKYDGLFSAKEKTILWFIGITSGVLPDFDIAYSVIKNLEDHRSFVTHGYFVYLLAFLVIYGFSYFQKKDEFGRKFFQVAATVFLLGVTTHLLIDFVIGGVAIFAPFHNTVYGFELNMSRDSGNRLTQYLLSRYMILEAAFLIMFFIFLRGKEYFVPRLLSVFYFIIASLSFVLVSLSFF
jgi:hypothetical protein